MRPISEATARIAGQNFNRKYIALGRIVKCWAEIVGENLASKAQPVKLRYRKREKSEKPEAALDIAVNSAEATLLHYQKDLILERINQIFGERWITAIRFVTIPGNQSEHKPARKTVPLTEDEKNNLSHIIAAVQDRDMRERLNSLGEAVIMEEKR